MLKSSRGEVNRRREGVVNFLDDRTCHYYIDEMRYIKIVRVGLSSSGVELYEFNARWITDGAILCVCL